MIKILNFKFYLNYINKLNVYLKIYFFYLLNTD